MTEQSEHTPVGGYYRSLAFWEHTAIAEHLLRLPERDRRRRFHGTVTKDGIDIHARRVLRMRRTKVIGWFHGGVLRATAELSWSPGAPAEAAFSVEPEFRRLGVGRGLAERVGRAASNRRLESLIVYTEIENIPMRRLAARLGAQTLMVEGEVEGRVPVGHASASSLWSELAEEERGFLYAIAQFWVRPWRNAQAARAETKRLATPEPLG